LDDFEEDLGEIERVYLFAGTAAVVGTEGMEGLRIRKVISRTTIDFMEG